MKKNISIIIVFALIATAGIYAKGQDESQFYRMPGGHGYAFTYEDQEPLELTGSLELVNGNPPYLKTSSEKYQIMVPYHLLYNLDIYDGEEISVTGYETSSGMWQWDDSEKGLYVTTAIIKGEEYNLSNFSGGNIRGGRGFGGPGGRGCRY